MDATRRAYFQLHVAVLLFGFTAILGDLIRLPAMSIVWWRLLMTCTSLLFLVPLRRLFRQTPGRLRVRFAAIGILIALQWLTFYEAVKLSNASITLVALSATSFFTSLIEPLFLRRPVKYYEVALGLLVVPGMAMVAANMEWSMARGLGVGILSAFFAAAFTSLNKKYVGGETDELSMTLLELGGAWLFLSLLAPLIMVFPGWEELAFRPAGSDWAYLIMLSLLCTTVAYVLALRALRHVSAFASTLAINLEPVYGIALAWIILREDRQLGGGFYLGVVIILAAVFSYPLLSRKMMKKASDEIS